MAELLLELEYQNIMLKECDGIVFQPFELDLEKMTSIKEEKENIVLKID